MKCILILGLLAVVIQKSYSQHDYITYVEENKYWFYGTSNGADANPQQISAYVIYFKKDTTISNVKYKKVFRAHLKGSHPCQFPPCFQPNIPFELELPSTIGFIREDIPQKKVYYLPIFADTADCTYGENELYNFNLALGDSISACTKNKIGVQGWQNNYGKIDSIFDEITFNKLRTTMTFKAPFLFLEQSMIALKTYYIVEGVGLTAYDLLNFDYNTFGVGLCEGSYNDCNFISSIPSTKEDNKIFFTPTQHQII